MSDSPVLIPTPPFPRQRPEITITPIDEPLFEVDWRELAWWFGIPEVGDHTRWAVYDPPAWQLTSHCDMQSVRPALVHGIEGVEVATVDYELGEEERINPWSLFARLTDSRVQYLATLSIQNGARRLFTLLDEGFDADWGESRRLIRHTGRFTAQPDGSYRQTGTPQPGETVEGMDICQVMIGNRAFTCLHVLDVSHEFNEQSILMEGYLDRDGRTILCRRYNGRKWHVTAEGAHRISWDERFPENQRFVIDGVTFVHWYDCLSDRACGLSK